MIIQLTSLAKTNYLMKILDKYKEIRWLTGHSPSYWWFNIIDDFNRKYNVTYYNLEISKNKMYFVDKYDCRCDYYDEGAFLKTLEGSQDEMFILNGGDEN